MEYVKKKLEETYTQVENAVVQFLMTIEMVIQAQQAEMVATMAATSSVDSFKWKLSKQRRLQI